MSGLFRVLVENLTAEAWKEGSGQETSRGLAGSRGQSGVQRAWLCALCAHGSRCGGLQLPSLGNQKAPKAFFSFWDKGHNKPLIYIISFKCSG